MEHARNVLGIEGAEHAEYGETDARVVVTPLSCDLSDATIDVVVRMGSRCEELYGRESVRERTTCHYGLAPELQDEVDRSGLHVVGIDDTGGARLVERDDHPFFVGSLFLPQFRPVEDGPHPLVTAFVRAAARGA